MGTILRRVIALVALAVGIGVAAGTAPAAAATTHSIGSSSVHKTIHLPAQGTHRAEPMDWWF